MNVELLLLILVLALVAGAVMLLLLVVIGRGRVLTNLGLAFLLTVLAAIVWYTTIRTPPPLP